MCVNVRCFVCTCDKLYIACNSNHVQLFSYQTIFPQSLYFEKNSVDVFIVGLPLSANDSQAGVCY